MRLAIPSARSTDRLTREARNDAIHDSIPLVAVEGSQIRPNRRLSQAAFFHPLSQDFAAVSLPFNEADRASASDFQCNSEFDAADT
jgi:hypothetical protein